MQEPFKKDSLRGVLPPVSLMSFWKNVIDSEVCPRVRYGFEHHYPGRFSRSFAGLHLEETVAKHELNGISLRLHGLGTSAANATWLSNSTAAVGEIASSWLSVVAALRPPSSLGASA